MRTLRPSSALAIAIVTLLVAIPAHAVSNRIFMSTNGNNSSDCANPLTPCLTFAGALAQVNPGGELIAESTGGYGALNITQAVTISGPTGVVIYSGLSVTVNAPGATVVLRGLTIDGSGAAASGISVVAVGTLFVENCVITGFTGVSAQGDGIFFGSAGDLFVKDTIIRGNAAVGIFVSPSSGAANATIDRCRLEGNGWGMITNSSGVAAVRDSIAAGNPQAGFQAQLGGEINLENCVAAHNTVGIQNSGSSLIRVSNTSVTGNATGISASGPVLSRSNNTVEGNTTADGAFTATYSAK